MPITHRLLRDATMLTVCLALGCSGGAERPVTPSTDTGAMKIYVVNYPLQYFAQRIVGDRAEVVFPAPADGDPAFWSPSDETVADYQQADLILLNGASYAKWVSKATLPESKLVNTSSGFEDKYILIEGAVTHSHGPEGAHAHGDTDFNTWLDPDLAILQAAAVAAAAGELMPAHHDEFQGHLAALKTDLEAIGDRLKQVTSRNPNLPLLGSHPVYNYLTRYCGWNLRSLHWEPNEMPDDDEWARLDPLLVDHPARWMIWEGEPDAAIVERLGTRGIRCAVFAPCGNVPATGDYLQAMQSNIDQLEPVFAPNAQPAE